MSWSIDLIGTRKGVKKKLAEQHLPTGVRAAIEECLNDPKPYTAHVRVCGHGHNNEGDSSGSNIGKLEVQPIVMIPD